VFWINVPVALGACVLTGLFIPESKAPRARRFDPVAQVLLALMLATLTFGIIEGARRGWTSPGILAVFAVSALALGALVPYERQRREPLVELRFFRSPPFAGATAIAVAAFSSLGGFLFLNTLYLQQTRGLSALRAGLDTLPMAAVTVVLAPLSGAVVGRRGARLPLVVGGAFIGASGLMLTRLAPGTSFVWLFAAYFLFGIGFGVVNAPITNTAVSGMPVAQAGTAAAVASTSRQVGQTLGVAVLPAIAASASGAAFPRATHPAWWAIVALGALVVALGLLSTTPAARRKAERIAETFEIPPAADPVPVRLQETGA
jgi:MFS family permease